jgi:hypothetical protein
MNHRRYPFLVKQPIVGNIPEDEDVGRDRLPAQTALEVIPFK